MTDRNTIAQVIESLFEDWIDKNINVHPLAVENMRMLEADALELLQEQKAKTGYWVSVNDGDVVAIDNDGFPERACFCSECKKYLIASDEYAVYGRYCPFCGAKMKGR